MPNTKVLAVCSPTAERLINERPGLEARSAGTEPSARIRGNEKLIVWADIILVMERRHLRRLKDRFPDLMSDKTVHSLAIPDDYRYMDKELVDLLNARIDELPTQS